MRGRLWRFLHTLETLVSFLTSGARMMGPWRLDPHTGEPLCSEPQETRVEFRLAGLLKCSLERFQQCLAEAQACQVSRKQKKGKSKMNQQQKQQTLAIPRGQTSVQASSCMSQDPRCSVPRLALCSGIGHPAAAMLGHCQPLH